MSHIAIETTPDVEPSPFADYVLPGAIVLVFVGLLVADWLPVIIAQRQRRTT